MSTTPPVPGRAPRRGRRALSVASGAVLGFIGLCVLAVGGFLVSLPKDGYIDLGHGAYQTAGHAVITEPYDWSRATFLGGAMRTVRLHVTQGQRPAFVGLARPGALRAYLKGVDYSTAHPGRNYHVTFTRHPGAAPETPPANASLWVAHATGTGPLTLRFPADQASGDLVAVAMNADGSPAVTGRLTSEASVPALPGIAWGTIAAGAVLTAGGIALIIVPLRRRRAARTS